MHPTFAVTPNSNRRMEKTIGSALYPTPRITPYTPFFLALIVLFVLSILIPKGMDVRFINGHHSLVANAFFSTLTNLGDGLIFIPVLLATVFIRFQYAIMTVILSVTHGVLVSLFKRIMFYGAARPRVYLGDDAVYFVPGVHVHSLHSFPSGHTATAFCAALFIALLVAHRGWSLLLLGVAVLVGCSRIYLAQHFLIDVAAGAIIGSFTTFMTWEVFRSNRTPPWMNQRLRLTPRRRQLLLR